MIGALLFVAGLIMMLSDGPSIATQALINLSGLCVWGLSIWMLTKTTPKQTQN